MRSDLPLPSNGDPLHAGNGDAAWRSAIRHVAIIMDGNGRWAEARGLARVKGHEHGVASVRAVTRHAARLGLDQLTLFAFSTENWKRPRSEVRYLMHLLQRYLVEERDELMENGVRLRSIGCVEGLPEEVQEALRATEALTADNRGMTLCLALNYGSRAELAEAARKLALDARADRIDVSSLSVEEIERALGERLYQPEMPPLDLLVRTAGEQRLSNFLLWQMSYGEFHVSDVPWPEFRGDDLDTALADYASRTRSFGGLLQR
jgi:undecaprenyl diphosphate synthase